MAKKHKQTKKHYWEEPEFIKLHDQWHEKLKADGFIDIEKHFPGRPQPRITRYSPPFTNARSSRFADWDSAKEAYFQAAGRYLYSGWFEDDSKEYKLWEQHCNGLAVVDMVQLELGHSKPLCRNKALYIEYRKLINEIEKHFIDWVLNGEPENETLED